MDLGFDQPDASPASHFDAPSESRLDFCGNGLDDDVDERIDEGCPCGPGEIQSCFSGAPSMRRVGMCVDGIQTCRAEGAEWGDWGNSPCEGSTTPVSSETCDGKDQDCDFANDEGCPCAAGEMRACGFAVLPCQQGIQRCGQTNSSAAYRGSKIVLL
jgi:hypothetical protein